MLGLKPELHFRKVGALKRLSGRKAIKPGLFRLKLRFAHCRWRKARIELTAFRQLFSFEKVRHGPYRPAWKTTLISDRMAASSDGMSDAASALSIASRAMPSQA